MSNAEVYLSLGGNLGNVPDTFRSAAAMLADGGLEHVRMSGAYRTTPVDCAPGTPDFINAALSGLWQGTPDALHRLCKAVESTHGRPAEHGRNESRTLDIDIIFFGQQLVNTPELTVPHREAWNRLFVLIPLAELAGEKRFPGGGGLTLDELLSARRNEEEFRHISAGRFPLEH